MIWTICPGWRTRAVSAALYSQSSTSILSAPPQGGMVLIASSSTSLNFLNMSRATFLLLNLSKFDFISFSFRGCKKGPRSDFHRRRSPRIGQTCTLFRPASSPSSSAILASLPLASSLSLDHSLYQ